MENENDNLKSGLIRLGGSLIVAGIAGYLLNKAYKAYKKSSTEKQVAESPEVRQAMSLYAAMNPSGIEWLSWADGTKSMMILDIAKEIKDIAKVQQEYKNLYGSSLMDDLRKDLSPEELIKFNYTLQFSPQNISKTGNKPTLNVAKGTYMITKLPANIRKTPKNISRWSFSNNIIRLADAGKSIGMATGKTEYDNGGENSGSGTLFVEIQSLSQDKRKPIFFWVAASQLQEISKEVYKSNKYPFLWFKEADILNGLEGLNYFNRRVISIQPVSLLDEHFKLVGTVPPFRLLGISEMELLTPKGKVLVKFRSGTNQAFWVNKKSIKIV